MTIYQGSPVAFVTGGGSGIGRETARRFGGEGCRVAIIDRNLDSAMQTEEMMEAEGYEALAIEADVAIEGEVQMAVQKTVQEYGGIDFAFNNAGIAGAGKLLHEHTYDEFSTTVSVNLVGVWLCMKYELEVMLPAGKGAIVNTASALGLVGFPNVGAYVASKHGVVGLTKAAAADYAALGIRINCVCPGHTRTPINEKYWADNPESETYMLAQEPVGRFGLTGEIAAAVLWLCSDGASFVHGHSLAVDGGMTVV